MFAIPVKIVEVSGGGEDLPLMTWDPDDPYYVNEGFSNDPDFPPYAYFSNLNTTVEGTSTKARGKYAIVPDRWYLEMKITDGGLSIPPIGSGTMYGFTNNSVDLADVFIGVNAWAISLELTGAVGEFLGPLVYIQSPTTLRFLSTDGLSALTEINPDDVFQFAGDKSSRTLWVGLNGAWLYWGEQVWDDINEVWEIEWSPLGDPETDDNPVFDDLPTTPYALCQTGDSGGPTSENVTLLTHTDDITYSPPTGFSVVSGDAEVTYVHVLRDRNLMPISQPTQHHLMGVLGL